MTLPERTSPRRTPLEQSIGDALRQARAARELTLAALSERSGVSTTMISKIERGRVSASLATLDALAAAIGIPIANLFASTVERRDVTFVRAGEGIRVRRSGTTYGHDYKMIGKVDTASTEFESHIITLEESAAGQPLFQHPGIEFIHMIEGAMSYRIGDDMFEMAPGDSVTFDAEAPHGPQALSTRVVRFMVAIARPRASDST